VFTKSVTQTAGVFSNDKENICRKAACKISTTAATLSPSVHTPFVKT
jgi:hypothetical protein